jgi:hypothetical protein
MTPREKFRANRSLTKGYNDLIASAQVQSALDAAMLEYDQSMTIARDITEAAANRWRKEGADAFRRMVENLNADSSSPSPAPSGQLIHQT